MKTNQSSACVKIKSSHAYIATYLRGCSAASFLLCIVFLLPRDADALGFRIPNQDAEAVARGNAFVATADNPSAVYYNPAGITQLDGQNVQFGFHAISINSFYNSPKGDSSESRFGIQGVPQLYYTYKLNDSISFGAGLYAPYGLALRWPVGSAFRADTTFQGELTYITLNPTMAYKINDHLSLALGPTFNYSQVLLREGIPAAFGGEFKFRGNAFDFGYKAGILWQPCEKWSFGAGYHSGTTMDYKGSASTYASSSSASARLPFGQFVNGGISFRPNKDWNIEADVDWTNWRALKSGTFENTPLGNITQRFDWHDSFMLGIGATRYLSDGYWVSIGYFYSEKSSTDFNFIPVVPDTDLHVGSLGLGHKGMKWAWALAAQIITGPDRTINNNANPGVDGRYQWVNASFNASLRRHF